MTASLSRMLLQSFTAGSERNHVPLDSCENLIAFSRRYGLRVPETGKKINVGNPTDPYAHLRTLWEDTHPAIVLQAGAQTGKSLWLLVRIIQAMIEHWGAFFGYYFPDYELPKKFSRDRFAPFIKNAPELAPWFAREEEAPKIGAHSARRACTSYRPTARPQRKVCR
jgi:hypothetical protein